MIENYYYVIATIVGCCTLIATLVHIMTKIFYSKSNGKVMESKLASIERLLMELINK